MDAVREKSSCIISITFKDADSSAVTPSSASYSLIDARSNSVLIPDTIISGLSSNVEVTIDASNNRILDASNIYEDRIFTLKYAYGAAPVKEACSEFWYRVLNLRKVT